MPAFHYQALTIKGEKQKGILEADSAKHARQLLRDQGLLPLDVAPVQQKKTGAVSIMKISRRQRLTSKELALITRQLATLLTAGLPLEEVLSAVAEQAENPRSKALLLSVRSKVLEGHALASGMRDFPYAFSDLYCSTVAAGEKSGHLDVVLQRLADYTEQQYAMRQKILHALIYPAIMVLVSIGIVGFLLEYVVPKMIAVYSNVGQNLPLMTRVLIAISSGFKAFGIYVLMFLAAASVLFFWQLRRSVDFRKKIDAWILHVPILGNAIKVINTARFSRTFAILSAAGVSVLDAMKVSAALVTNLPIRESIEAAANRVREGIAIHSALKQTGTFRR